MHPPEDIPLRILYEDADLVAIDKPAGMVVHAGAGVHSGTLVNALLHHFEALSAVGGALRPGIVHRLDRYTSGVLLVAKNDAAHHALAEQFSGRQVEKTYIALVHGKVKAESGRIDRPITRDPVHRTRMTARLGEGRAAWSEYRVIKRFERFTLLEVKIGTGRTHQIRVHLSGMGHAVAGDTLYGAPAKVEGHAAAGAILPARASHSFPSALERRGIDGSVAAGVRVGGVAHGAHSVITPWDSRRPVLPL